MTSQKDLWGDLPSIETIRTPYTILKEQASVLTEKTKGLLIGEVKQSYQSDYIKRLDALDKIKSLGVQENPQSQPLVAFLRIKVPSLNNYTYSVVKIQFPIPQLYPVSINNFVTADDEEYKCSDEAEFENALGKILSSDDVKQVISALLAQVYADRSQPQQA